MATENLEFDVDKNILYDVISRQAGSRGKSILEGVQNAIDAKATHIQIETTHESFRVIDDGHGMTTREEIHEVFKTFGKPQERGDRAFSRFHIGRGQLMVWGHMLWSTAGFDLDVDFKNKGLRFDLIERDTEIQGTDIRVNYYTPLTRMQLLELDREIRTLTQYITIPVYLNGEQINTLPQDMKWDHETDQYWIKIKGGAQSAVEFYNQGAFVCRQSMGVGAIVISKPGYQFCLNMARNQILEDQDQVYGEIKQILRDEARKRSTDDHRRMDDSLRREILTSISAGEYDLGINGADTTIMKLRERATFVNALGRGVPPERMGNRKWCFAPKRQAERADALIQKGVVVLDPIMLEWVGICDQAHAANIIGGESPEKECELGERFVNLVFGHNTDQLTRRFATEADRINERLAPFNDLASEMTSDHEELNRNKDLTRKEQTVFTALGQQMRVINSAFVKAANDGLIDPSYAKQGARELLPGRSDSAEAWTDGARRVWINKENLRIRDADDAQRLIAILIHEHCHQFETSGSHEHDFDFYATFHEVMLNAPFVRRLTKDVMKDYVARLRQKGIHVSKVVETQDVILEDVEQRESV